MCELAWSSAVKQYFLGKTVNIDVCRCRDIAACIPNLSTESRAMVSFTLREKSFHYE
jgi:hypothetical protein